MKRKTLWIIALVSLLLSIFVMLLPDAYVVKWCFPPPSDPSRWTDTFSYFDTSLLSDFFDSYEDIIFVPFAIVAALACNAIFLFRLVFKKLSKTAFIFLGVGLLTSLITVASARFATVEGYPNCLPFISAIAAILSGGLLLLLPLFNKAEKLAFVAMTVGLVAAIFSALMSHLITIPGLAIAGLFLLALALYSVYLKRPKSPKERIAPEGQSE